MMKWLQGYRDITVSAAQLIIADARLAAVSLAQLLFLTLIAAFAVIAVWSGLMSIIAILLNTVGWGWLSISVLLTLFHLLLFVVSAMAIQSYSKGLNFTASRKMLSGMPGPSDNPASDQQKIQP